MQTEEIYDAYLTIALLSLTSNGKEVAVEFAIKKPCREFSTRHIAYLTPIL